MRSRCAYPPTHTVHSQTQCNMPDLQSEPAHASEERKHTRGPYDTTRPPTPSEKGFRWKAETLRHQAAAALSASFLI